MIDEYLWPISDEKWRDHTIVPMINSNIVECLSENVVIKHIKWSVVLNDYLILDKLLSLFKLTFSCYSGKISDDENKMLFITALQTEWSSVVALEENWELLRFAIVIDEWTEVEIDKLWYNPKIKSKYFVWFMKYLLDYYIKLDKSIRCEFALEARIWPILVNQFEFSVYWLKYSYKWVPFFVAKYKYLWPKRVCSDNDWMNYFNGSYLLDLWLECITIYFPVRQDPKDYIDQTNDLFSYIWKFLEQWKIIDYYKLYNDKLYVFLK